MSKNIELSVGKHTYLVKLPNIQAEIIFLKFLKDSIFEGGKVYHRLGESAVSKRIDIRSDLEEMEEVLREISKDPEMLVPYVEKLHANGWGELSANSVVDVYCARNIAEYDRTNDAWSAFVIGIEVIDGQTCELVIKCREFSYAF